jgi:hypothetical protein
MKIQINKHLLLEATIIDKLSNFFKDIKTKFFNKSFKYLNDDDIKILLIFIYNHYYLNQSISATDFKKLKIIFEKIKGSSEKPVQKKLYRGLSFKTEKDLNSFITKSKKDGIQGYSNNQYREYASWSSDINIARKFCEDIPGNYIPRSHKFGIMLELSDTNVINKQFVFSMESFLENVNEKKEFIKFIYQKQFEKNIKLIDNTKRITSLDPNKMVGEFHGTLYSVMENEYILNTVPWDSIKYTIHKFD